MKARSALMIAISEHIKHLKLTQADAAKRLGVTQPRVSDLVRGKIDLFSLKKGHPLCLVAGWAL
jgi:predicted XRE-type DNA-binding protein